MVYKAEGPRAVGIPPPSARLGNRREREDPREWYLTHPWNRWVKRAQVCGCQSNKASGESRPGTHLSFLARSKGGGHQRWACEPTQLQWIFPPGFQPQNVRWGREKENEPAVRQEKGNLLEGKERVTGPWGEPASSLSDGVFLITHQWKILWRNGYVLACSWILWSCSQRFGIWWSRSFEKVNASEKTECHLGNLVSLKEHCDFISCLWGQYNDPS